jgi:hypothetical protein
MEREGRAESLATQRTHADSARRRCETRVTPLGALEDDAASGRGPPRARPLRMDRSSQPVAAAFA